MSHNARIRSAGFWTNGSVLQASELESFDVSQFKSINGDDGGTWAPAIAITLGGAGLTVTGPFTVSGASNHILLTSRTIGPRCENSVMEQGATNLCSVRTSVVNVGDSNFQALRLPDGSTLTAVTITVDPTNASPPAGTQVGFKVTKRSLSTGVATDIFATLLDPTAGASYGPVHQFTKSGLSEVIDRANFKYFVECVGESGTGAASVVWYGASWTATVGKVDEGAS